MIARSLLVTVIMFATAGKVIAQPFIPKDIQALRVQLNKSSADTTRVRLLVELGRYYNSVSANNPKLNDSALLVATKAQKLSASLSYLRGTALSYQVMAKSWCNKHDFKKSDEFIKKAVTLFLDQGLFEDAAEAYINMEEFYMAAGGLDYNIMIGYYEQAAPLFKKAGAKLRAAATLSILGDFYLQIDKNREAIDNLQAALTLYRSTGYKPLQSVYDLLGNNYLMINNFKEALKYALLAVKTAEAVQDTTMLLCTIYNRTGMVYYSLYQYPQATIYYRKAIVVAQKYHDRSVIILALNLANNLGHQNSPVEAIKILRDAERRFSDISESDRTHYNATYLQAYVALKRYNEADQYSEKLLTVYRKHKYNVSTEINMLGPVLQYFIATKQYQRADAYLPEFEIIARKMRVLPKFVLRTYLFRYQIDSAQHNYASAMHNYMKYAILKDSISETIKNKQMQELQVQYETEKKGKENAFLKKESLLQANRVKQADRIRDLTLIGTVVLLIFVILLYYSFRINQKNSRKISEKNVSLHKLIVEKEWLLKEIHHRVKNNLQIVMGLLQRQSAYIDNDDALAAIQNSENRMRSIALIHQKLYQSENLDLIFMAEYIDEMITNLKDSCGLDNRIFFEKHVDDIYLDVAQAVPLGLILNEAITNAIKYAYQNNSAGIIYISLIKGINQQVQLTIADNGPGLPKGFNINKVESLGINLMRGLSKQLGGTFAIVNDDGCTINIGFKSEIFNRSIAQAEITLT
jgi:two-component sensor histidine kinase